MGDTQAIVNWFYLHEFGSTFINFDDHVVVAIEKALDKSRLDAETYAIANGNRIWNALRRQIEDHKGRKLFPAFSEVPGDWRRLFCYPQHVPYGLSKKAKHERVRFRSRTHILRWIEHLEPREYEAVSGLACKLSGASHLCLTRQKNEQGVDFLAVVPSFGKSRLLNGATGPIRIVGQSKKYSNSVQVDKLRDFSTTLNLVRHRNTKVSKILPPWFLQQTGSIVGWFVAHRGLQSGAVQFSNEFGILYSDSWDIAEILLRSRSWQPTHSLNTPVEFAIAELKSILERNQYES